MAKKTRRVAAASAANRADNRADSRMSGGRASGAAATGATTATTAASGATRVTPRRASRRPDVIRQRKEARRVQYERRQRQWLWTKIAIGAIALAIIGGLGFAGFRQFEQWQVSRDVESYFGANDFVGQHDPTGRETILYEQVPPIGGWHRAAWQNCGYYDTFINNENGVHALEHGAVWITYDPSLPQDQIDSLAAKAEQDYVLVSPYPGMDAPVVASVWGKQLKLDGAGDSRLDPFIREYRKNPDNSPEPLGICYGGLSATTDTVPQQEPYVRADPDGPPVGGILASQATATAAALNPPAATPPAPAATPAAPAPAATPMATPAASPVTETRAEG